jgi:hypothetical protein
MMPPSIDRFFAACTTVLNSTPWYLVSPSITKTLAALVYCAPRSMRNSEALAFHQLRSVLTPTSDCLLLIGAKVWLALTVDVGALAACSSAST